MIPNMKKGLAVEEMYYQIIEYAVNIGLLLCRQTKRSINFLFAYQQQFRLTERRWTEEYILYFWFFNRFQLPGGQLQNTNTAASRFTLCATLQKDSITKWILQLNA